MILKLGFMKQNSITVCDSVFLIFIYLFMWFIKVMHDSIPISDIIYSINYQHWPIKIYHLQIKKNYFFKISIF